MLAAAGRLVLLVVATGGLLALAEWAAPEGDRRTVRDPVESRRHLAFIALYVVVATVIAALLLRLQGALVDADLAPRIQTLPMAVQVALALVLGDVMSYGLHRGAHRYSWWWQVHVVHHRATDVRWWTAYRAHPIQVAIDHLVPAAVLLLIGFGPGSLAARAVIVSIVALFAHTDVEVPDRWLRYVIATPGYHRTHHEADRTGVNFALVLPVLDLLGGTADFSRREDRRFGLDAGQSGISDRVIQDRVIQDWAHTPTQNENTLTSPASTAAVARLP